MLTAHTDIVDHNGMMTPKSALNPQNDFDAGYLAGRNLLQSRNAVPAVSKGTSNYVVFDPKMVSIIRKYGIPGIIATGATAIGGNADAATHAIPVDHDPFAESAP